MWNRAVIALCLIPLLAPCTAAAQSFDRAQIRLFKTLHRLPGALARYDYLQKTMPDLAKPDRIVAMQLLSRLRERHSVDLPLRSFFENPTVSALASLVEHGTNGSHSSTLSPIKSVSNPTIDQLLSDLN